MKASQGDGEYVLQTLPHHYNLNAAIMLRQKTNIEILVASNKRLTNPFMEESSDLHMVMKVEMPENMKKMV